MGATARLWINGKSATYITYKCKYTNNIVSIAFKIYGIITCIIWKTKEKMVDIPLLSERRYLPWTVFLQKGMIWKPISFLIADEKWGKNRRKNDSNVMVVLDAETPIVKPCASIQLLVLDLPTFTTVPRFQRDEYRLIVVSSGPHRSHQRLLHEFGLARTGQIDLLQPAGLYPFWSYFLHPCFFLIHLIVRG